LRQLAALERSAHVSGVLSLPQTEILTSQNSEHPQEWMRSLEMHSNPKWQIRMPLLEVVEKLASKEEDLLP